MNLFSKRLLLGSSISFGLLIVCILIRPASLAANDGLSYFGVYFNTVFFYSAAFLAYALTFWKVSTQFKIGNHTGKSAANSLRAMSALLLGLIATPHNAPVFGVIHVWLGASLFVIQLIISLVVMLILIGDWLVVSLVAVELSSGLLSLIYLPTAHGLMIQCQIIYQLAFVLLLLRISNRLGHFIAH
ncbi:MAG: hypothetical protein ACXWLH_02345 [Candidatus Saccharimonadales bacterium]